jgi:predicted transcriptional regulator
MELITVRLPKKLKDKLQAIAEEQHRPLSNLVRIIIMEYLKNLDKKPEK